MKTKILGLLTLGALIGSVSTAQANIVWNWSFGSEGGTFVTDGSASNGVAAPGTYSFLDFSVSDSGAGATIGSLSGGQYSASGFATVLPYSFNWDGNAVTFWDSAGGNSFDWWVFDDIPGPGTYFFGWETTNINNPTQGAYYLGNLSEPSYLINVSVAGARVPEPGTLALLGLGLAGLGLSRRRKAN